MTVTPIYTNPKMNLLRSYIKGFVGSSGTSNFAIVGNFVEFDYLFPLYHIKMKIKPQFQAPNSNRYTLDWIFDIPASSVTLSGSPIDAGIGIKFHAMRTESTFRVQLLATLSVDETQKADLFPLVGYWCPPA